MTDISTMKDAADILKKLEMKLERVKKQLQDAEDQRDALLCKYEEEKKDVTRLKENTLSGFILKVVKQYDRKLEKEIREEVHAKEQYDGVITNIAAIQNEKEELEKQITTYRELAKKYENEMDRRKIQLYHQPTNEGRAFKKLEDERENMVFQHVEIIEALKAAEQLWKTIQEASRALNSADDWASIDMWLGGGIITHAVKYSHIDDAEECFHRLSAQIQMLKAELSDVKNLQENHLSPIKTSERIFDFWFDGIFVDWYILDQIKKNRKELEKLEANVNKVMLSLNEQLKMLQEELSINEEKQNRLLGQIK